MGWREDLAAARQWVEDAWDDLDPSIKRQIEEGIERATNPTFVLNFVLSQAETYIAESIENQIQRLQEIRRELEDYIEDPARLLREFEDYIRPRTQFGQMAHELLPGTEDLDSLTDEIRRPIILIPGMVGTRLMRPEGSVPGANSTALPPDRLQRFMEEQFRSADSALLHGLPESARNILLPYLIRISDRHLYNPRTVWDPDTAYAMIDLMNKTAAERGRLFCPDDTEAEPASAFATEVAESMTIEGYIGFKHGPLLGRLAREIRHARGISADDWAAANQRYAGYRRRRELRGWAQPVWGVSEHWLLPLERTFNEVVYAFGYDWRQPVLISVEKLIRKIRRVQDHHDGKAPILVTHSFGGILARGAAKRVPESIAGVVQVFSPTAGAVKPYTNFKKGGGGTLPPGWDREDPPEPSRIREQIASLPAFIGLDFEKTTMDTAFAILLGWDANAFVATSSGTYGLYSLLPNNVPRFNVHNHWINIEDDTELEAELTSTSNIYDLYRDFGRPWGLISDDVWAPGSNVQTGDESERFRQWLASLEGEAASLVRLFNEYEDDGYLRLFQRETFDATHVQVVRERVLYGIDQAEKYDRLVGDYVHPNTWSLYSSGRTTSSGFNIRRINRERPREYATRRIVSDHGDGTVETPSSRALLHRIRGEIPVPGAHHADVMKDEPAARSLLVRTVVKAMVAAHRAAQP